MERIVLILLVLVSGCLLYLLWLAWQEIGKIKLVVNQQHKDMDNLMIDHAKDPHMQSGERGKMTRPWLQQLEISTDILHRWKKKEEAKDG